MKSLHVQPIKLKPLTIIENKSKIAFKPTTHIPSTSFTQPSLRRRFVEPASHYLTEEQINQQQKEYNKTIKNSDKIGSKIGMNDGPRPDQKDFDKFYNNRDKTIKGLVESKAKKHNSILHGKHNVNYLFAHYLGKERARKAGLIKPTYDYDVWALNAKQRAIEMQKAIDKQIGADIAYAEKEINPPAMKSRWVVRIKDKPEDEEVDYATIPNPKLHMIETTTINGIRRETLRSSASRDLQILHGAVPMLQHRAPARLERYEKFRKMEKK